jgi:hypothetical protein
VLRGVSVSLSGWWRGWWLVKKDCALWRVSVSGWLVAFKEGVCEVVCQCLWVAAGLAAVLAGGVAGGRTGNVMMSLGRTRRE